VIRGSRIEKIRRIERRISRCLSHSWRDRTVGRYPKRRCGAITPPRPPEARPAAFEGAPVCQGVPIRRPPPGGNPVVIMGHDAAPRCAFGMGRPPLNPAPGTVSALARQLFGEPNRALSTARELRFGRRGSLAVLPDRGVFRDFESGVSGGVLDMVVHAGAARDRSEAARLLQSREAIPPRETPRAVAARELRDAQARNAKIAIAGALWKAGKPFAGTTAEIYLRRARAIGAPLEAAGLRFLPDAPFTPYAPDHRRHPAMVAAVVNGGGQLTGAHITYLRSDGSGKADVTPSRKMVGAVSGGHVPLIPGVRLVVAEGLESTLSAWEAAVNIEGLPRDTLGAVAGLSAGGVAALAWPSGASAMLIAPDRDASGAGQRAAEALAYRAYAAGLSVAFLRPPEGCSDWNALAVREAEG
jgi:hypothetical protein